MFLYEWPMTFVILKHKLKNLQGKKTQVQNNTYATQYGSLNLT